MEELVKNLLAAYRQSIDKLEWMSPETKKEAHAKLAKFTAEDRLPGQVARLLRAARSSATTWSAT